MGLARCATVTHLDEHTAMRGIEAPAFDVDLIDLGVIANDPAIGQDIEDCFDAVIEVKGSGVGRPAKEPHGQALAVDELKAGDRVGEHMRPAGMAVGQERL